MSIDPALYAALKECVKYIAKSSKLANLNREQFAILDQQARGIRQCNLGGLLKDKRYQAQEPEVLDPSIWEFLEKEFYRWCDGDYQAYTPSEEPKVSYFKPEGQIMQ
ncbi:protein rep [Helicobacter felis]|uniref:protein rep n=1 Tax=Helicobacter felis TaxID=214 RepID=UPI000CF12CB6|nr:protein rep [Helicobacter felis]